ncbi:phage shock protein PspA [Oceanimonas baumannii]|uniref:Phage shock protein A (PspA) family protein n=1 Tax=Oceanimonas baumannii TaxID=129578 RepID=A0A235CKF0_9GAMM|nr:phage shock protein PspA [Oceanimonas baumannii]MCC4265120.1 phage shock protein PspA [Oceanimonas baumannii]OYD25061.1 phage shock protein PspA [Oceanimonas baumannii]TDW59841.1 phage shock protein A (PspA) family protein [Oceanimonas baumannii]
MSIFSRMADIINANLNSLLDKAEDPEKMVRLIIQEMEDELVRERSSLARMLAEKKDLLRQIDRHRERVEEWQGKAELALTKQREELARAALLEKKKQSDLLTALEQECSLVEESMEKLADAISRLEAKLGDARARQQAMQLRQQSAQSRINVQERVRRSENSAAIDKFDRMERKIDELEARADLYSQSKGLDQEFAELEVDETISKELERLKAKMHNDKESQ